MRKILSAITALSLVAFLAPAAAFAGHYSVRVDRGVNVDNRNTADIRNTVNSTANTGHNWAGGSQAGSGGSSGDINTGSKGEVENSGTGHGGHGGSSYDGGFVQTGNAATETLVLNEANENYTLIKDDCKCVPDVLDRRHKTVRWDDWTNVDNRNTADIRNTVNSTANTGHNSAGGSQAGSGGSSGDINAGYKGEVEKSGTGHGGHGGRSGVGGEVRTGTALTSTEVVTIVNRNVTRVLR
jgi:hypothetical protein